MNATRVRLGAQLLKICAVLAVASCAVQTEPTNTEASRLSQTRAIWKNFNANMCLDTQFGAEHAVQVGDAISMRACNSSITQQWMLNGIENPNGWSAHSLMRSNASPSLCIKPTRINIFPTIYGASLQLCNPNDVSQQLSQAWGTISWGSNCLADVGRKDKFGNTLLVWDAASCTAGGNQSGWICNGCDTIVKTSDTGPNGLPMLMASTPSGFLVEQEAGSVVAGIPQPAGTSQHILLFPDPAGTAYSLISTQDFGNYFGVTQLLTQPHGSFPVFGTPDGSVFQRWFTHRSNVQGIGFDEVTLSGNNVDDPILSCPMSHTNGDSMMIVPNTQPTTGDRLTEYYYR